MRPLTVHLDLGKHGKGHLIILGAKLLNFRQRTRFLLAELITGESQHGKPFGIVLRMHGL